MNCDLNGFIVYIKYKVMVKCFNNFTVATIAKLKIYSIFYEVFNSALEGKCLDFFIQRYLYILCYIGFIILL